MRRRWVTVLLGLLVCVSAGVLALDARESPQRADATVLARGGVEGTERDGDGGHGPPPWANAGGVGGQRDKEADSWKDDWRALTPAQKAQTMAALARAHETGMRDWKRCVRAAGTDVEKRACEKPLPPGIAKKQPS